MDVAPATANYANADTFIRTLYRQDLELKCAVQGANIERVEEMIASGTDVNLLSNQLIHDEPYNNLRHLPKLVSPLIDSINLLGPTSPHPSNVTMDIFDLLLNSGADLNQPCPYVKHTPLMYAAEIGNINCVKKLIGEGADIFPTDRRGLTACTIAARAGSVDVLKCLIEDYNFDKDYIDKNGRSVLYWAVSGKKIEVVRYLLELGVTITKYMPQECVKPCNNCGTNLPYINSVELDYNPWIAAFKSGRLNLVRLMEEYGCQIHKHPYALSYAVHANRVEMVEYLLNNYKYSLNFEYILPMNFQNVESHQPWTAHHTLLTCACYYITPYYLEEVVKLLLEYGADPNTKSRKCITAINVAVYLKHVEVIACFIRAGANVNAKSFFPEIGVVLPFEAAVWRGHTCIAQMLFVSGSSFGVFSLPKEHKCKVNIDPDMQELLKEWNVYKNNVLPLRQLCRMVILNHLCPRADTKITQLSLPSNLIRYLSIPELDDII